MHVVFGRFVGFNMCGLFCGWYCSSGWLFKEDHFRGVDFVVFSTTIGKSSFK